MLEINKAVFGYRSKRGDKVILDGLSFSLDRGELLCILGANGVGKTTMYRTVLGFIPLIQGNIRIDGADIGRLSKVQLAKQIAYVPQYHTPPFPYSVFDVVLMGRSAHLQQFATPGKEDEKITCEMMERMGILHLKDEIYTEISGGERQLVLIARALAQQAAYILMDEPASNLDYGNQMRMLKTIKDLTEEGMGICFTSHNPNHAFLTNASVLAIQDRYRSVKGNAREVITEQLLQDMYGVDANIQQISDSAGNQQPVIMARI